MKSLLLVIALTLSFANEIFAQNAGEIIFSSSAINPNQPTGSKTDFQAGDRIYALAYLPKLLKEMYSNTLPNAKLEVEVFIYEIKPPLYDYQQPYEEQLTFASMWVTGSVLNNKYLVIDLVPDVEKTTAYGSSEITYKEFGKKFDGPVNFAETLSKLSSGEHNLKVLVKCNYNDVASSMLKISGTDFSEYSNMANKLNLFAQNAGANNAVFPEALKKDATAESQMIAALKSSNDWKSGWLNATDILKISIVDADWYVRKHEISGAILHRYIRAAFAVKTKEGTCAYFQATFQEDYVGGKFQPLHYDGAGDRNPINCENVSK